MTTISCSNGTIQIDNTFAFAMQKENIINGSTFSGTTSELELVLTSK